MTAGTFPHRYDNVFVQVVGYKCVGGPRGRVLARRQSPDSAR
jgi:hypothetical protein